MKLPDQMPGSMRSIWRTLKRGYQAEPWLLSVAFGLALLAALPDALMAWWLKLMTDGVIRKNSTILMVAALGLGVCSCGTWFLRVISDRTQRRFRDRLTIALQSHVAQLQASPIRNDPNTWTGWPSCVTRFSCWTICICRSFPRAGGFCD